MERSVKPHVWKGREGNGMGSGKDEVKFSTHPQSVPATPSDAAKTITGGGHDHTRCCRYLFCAHPACCGYRGQR